MSRRRKNDVGGSVLRELGGWLLYILIIVGLTYLIITFVGQRTRVSGYSMEPTLSDGDSLIVDKISYRFRDPKRFDIIVFPYKYEKNTYYIKRIIGLPGETVQVTDGYVYINGQKLESDTYGAELMQAEASPVTLSEDEYFVMGDNHAGSDDSRMADIGNVKRSEIFGKVWFVASPGPDFGFVRR